MRQRQADSLAADKAALQAERDAAQAEVHLGLLSACLRRVCVMPEAGTWSHRLEAGLLAERTLLHILRSVGRRPRSSKTRGR